MQNESIIHSLVCLSHKLLSMSRWRYHFVGNWTGFAQQIHKNYKILCISSDTSLHHENLITTVLSTHVVTRFPDLEFICRSYFKIRVKLLLFSASWNSSASSGSDNNNMTIECFREISKDCSTCFVVISLFLYFFQSLLKKQCCDLYSLQQLHC